jgi:hypothetical protein
VLESLAAFNQRGTPDRICTPLDYSLRVSRVSTFANPWTTGDFLGRSGMGYWDRVTPDGFPDTDSAFTDSNAVLQRFNYCSNARWSLVQVIPGPMRWPANPSADERQRMIDAMAVGLTGKLLSESSNRSAVEYAATLKGNGGEVSLALCVFVASLPEAQMR